MTTRNELKKYYTDDEIEYHLKKQKLSGRYGKPISVSIVDYERLRDIQAKLGLASIPETIRYMAHFLLPLLTDCQQTSEKLKMETFNNLKNIKDDIERHLNQEETYQKN